MRILRSRQLVRADHFQEFFRILFVSARDILLHRFSPTGFYSSAVRNPFLSGEVSGDLYVAPTHEVAPPPPGGGYVDGRTFLNNAREVFTEDGVYGGGGGTPARPSPTSAPSSGGGAEPVAVGVGLYLLAKLAGFL